MFGRISGFSPIKFGAQSFARVAQQSGDVANRAWPKYSKHQTQIQLIPQTLLDRHQRQVESAGAQSPMRMAS
jgi:hypothetical protein